MTSLLIGRGDIDTTENIKYCYMMLNILPSQTRHSHSLVFKKRRKKGFQSCRIGGLERFEMLHVALILRVETDGITASFRNLLYCVSQSQWDFPLT